MDIYREVILDHYKFPRNFGHLDRPSAASEEHNVSCGDRIAMEVRFDGTGKKIADVRFSGEGCAISIASASMLTEKIKGMDRKRLMALTQKDVLDLMGITLTPTRLKCALLPLEVAQKTANPKKSG